MTISYLRGEDNHLSDQLSRAPDCIVPVWGTNCRRCRIRIAVLLVTKNTYTYFPLGTYLIYIALRTTLTVRLLRARRLLCISHYLLTSLHDPQTLATAAIVLM